MFKKMITMLLVAALLVFPVMTAFAAESDVEITDGSVEWDGSKLNSNLSDIQQAINNMQPGDKVTYKVTLKNTGSTDTDFWMSNEIIRSFEDNGRASDGAYTYYLAYTGPDGTEVFYNSAKVGGLDANGLHDVPDGVDSQNLDEDFFLGKLSKGQTGTVELIIMLDGETQGNSYQQANAILQLKFGVEERTTTTVTKTENKTITKTVTEPSDVKTGDDFNLMPLYIAALACGVLLVVVATGRRKKAVNNR